MSGELTQRLGQANVAQQQGGQMLKPGARPATVLQLFSYDVFRGEMMRVLNDKDLVRRTLQAGLTELQRIPKLAECSWQSMAGALLQCATVKLEPGPAMGHCWVLPFNGVATFVLGYPGVVQLAWRTGLVADINAQPVREGEDFFYDAGANIISHKRAFRGRPGETYAYYSIVRYVNGGRHIEFMTLEQVLDHAQRHSKSYQSGRADSPWRTDRDKMGCKTCVLQGKNMMPASVEWVAATAADERASIWTPGSGLRPEDVLPADLPGRDALPAGEDGAKQASPGSVATADSDVTVDPDEVDRALREQDEARGRGGEEGA